jgi:hypothetical protein
MVHTEEALKTASYCWLVNRNEIDSTVQVITNIINNSEMTYYDFSKTVF